MLEEKSGLIAEKNKNFEGFMKILKYTRNFFFHSMTWRLDEIWQEYNTEIFEKIFLMEFLAVDDDLRCLIAS